MDVIILLDRLSIFLTQRLRFIKRAKPIYPCLIILAISIILNVPIDFSYEVLVQNLGRMSRTKYEWLYFVNDTPFAREGLGLVLNIALFFIKDIFTLVLIIILNYLLIYYLRKHLSIKSKLTNGVNKQHSSSATLATIATSFGQKSLLRTKIKQALKQANNNNNINNNNKTTNMAKLVSISDKKTIQMVVFMCVMVALEHAAMIFFVSCCIWHLLEETFWLSVVISLTLFMITLRNASNFFAFFLFNTNFNRIFKRIIKIC